MVIVNYLETWFFLDFSMVVLNQLQIRNKNLSAKI